MTFVQTVATLSADIRPGNGEGWPRTSRQHDLCFFFVLHGLNAVQAASKAGYSDQMARKKAALLLRELQPYCNHLQALKNAAIQERLEITAARVADELATIGFSNLLEYLKPVVVAGRRRFVGKAPDELTASQARAVSRMRVVEIHDRGEVVYDYQYQLHDKSDALADLAKYLGMFDADLSLQQRGHAGSGVDLSNVPDSVLEKWMGELASYRCVDRLDLAAPARRRA